MAGTAPAHLGHFNLAMPTVLAVIESILMHKCRLAFQQCDQGHDLLKAFVSRLGVLSLPVSFTLISQTVLTKPFPLRPSSFGPNLSLA